MYFFYLNVGPEIVRIEIPKWVAKDVALLQRVHAMAHDQAQKGQGYPVSLSEAHEQAVIRSSEREQFYRLLENLYIQKGLEVNLSRKVLKNGMWVFENDNYEPINIRTCRQKPIFETLHRIRENERIFSSIRCRFLKNSIFRCARTF